MNIVPIGVTGKIVSPGDRYGWFVKVEDDAQDTRGYFVLEWNDSASFDCWVENREAVDRFFRETGWKVFWSVDVRED
jgi:hypothetical protein